MTTFRKLALAAALIAAGITLTAAASDHGRRGREEDRDHDGREEHEGRAPAPGLAATGPDATYAKECGACHLAFQPSHLPASGWRGVMAGLDRHFGQDAALDEATRARLEGWLVERAGREPAAPAADPLRITGQRWFVREHREVPAGAASRKAVGSMANCTACHAGAARWDFDEDRVKIPRG